MTALVISEVVVAEYHMPLRRSFTTSRLTTRTARNVVVRIRARQGGRVVEGIGEGAPRGIALTGDHRDAIWPFLLACVDGLLERRLEARSPAGTLDELRALGGMLRAWACERQTDPPVERPFRGTLCAIEMALLDLAARAHERSVADLCGARRGELTITAATASSDRVAGRRGRRFPAVRFKATGDPAADLATLRRLAGGRRGRWPWIDVNEAYPIDVAEDFVLELARAVRRRRIPPQAIVEQPVAKDRVVELARLQAVADRALHGRDARITIMADESFWDVEDLDPLLGDGGCAALNIKLQKTGGPLAALDCARSVATRAPAMQIYLGNMIGTSDLTAWSLVHLGRAVPRLDHLTTTPPRNIEAHVTSPALTYGRSRDRLAVGTGPGYGSTIDLVVLEPYVVRLEQRSVVGPRSAATTGDLPSGLHRFSRRGLYGYLLERAALSHGCTVERTSESLFVAESPDGYRVGFAGMRSHHTSPVAVRLSGHKPWARELLLAADVPVPPGRPVRLDDTALERAAEQVGYPVVLKPVGGAGGRGVHLDLRDAAAVLTAAKRLRQGGAARALLERYVAGSDVRCLVVGGEVVSAIARRPAQVIGDGRVSIRELVALQNGIRRGSPYLRHRLIPVDEAVGVVLASQGFGWDDVPAHGVEVQLSGAANVSRGGTSIEVLDETPAEVAGIAVAAVAAIPGLRVAGVDLLVPAAPTATPAYVCEVNSIPSTSLHHFPMAGPPRDVSLAILRDAFETEGSRLPDELTAVGVRLQVHGKVQAVGFRRWMRRIAREHEVRGWVSNHRDGDRVDARLGGGPADVAVVTALAIQGPPAAEVRYTRVRPDPSGIATGRFRIREP
jgi:D-alanine-D-alanine ligase-like ATP-grasp enzyme/L-alanine-DL-glutamate epimerase-like enolase superfamily enzyme/acylphosphatase